MELDSYWRTQTISEAQAQGHTHLRATCPCGRIADLHRNTFPWNIPLRCQKCWNTEPLIGVPRQTDARGISNSSGSPTHRAKTQPSHYIASDSDANVFRCWRSQSLLSLGLRWDTAFANGSPSDVTKRKGGVGAYIEAASVAPGLISD